MPDEYSDADWATDKYSPLPPPLSTRSDKSSKPSGRLDESKFRHAFAEPSGRRTTTLLAICLAVVVLAGAVTGVFIYRSGSEQSPRINAENAAVAKEAVVGAAEDRPAIEAEEAAEEMRVAAEIAKAAQDARVAHEEKKEEARVAAQAGKAGEDQDSDAAIVSSALAAAEAADQVRPKLPNDSEESGISQTSDRLERGAMGTPHYCIDRHCEFEFPVDGPAENAPREADRPPH
jgi:hypothetical protein